MRWLLPKIAAADVLVLGAPLYVYHMPAPLKAIADRTIPLASPRQVVVDGESRHPSRDGRETGGAMLLVSVCGFWERHNFDHLCAWTETLCRASNARFAGKLLRPHAYVFSAMPADAPAKVKVVEALEQAARELVGEGSGVVGDRGGGGERTDQPGGVPESRQRVLVGRGRCAAQSSVHSRESKESRDEPPTGTGCYQPQGLAADRAIPNTASATITTTSRRRRGWPLAKPARCGGSTSFGGSTSVGGRTRACTATGPAAGAPRTWAMRSTPPTAATCASRPSAPSRRWRRSGRSTPIAEYGLPDLDEQVAAYEKMVQDNRAAWPDQLTTGGYYRSTVSGCIAAFGWDMFLLACADRRKIEPVLERFARLHALPHAGLGADERGGDHPAR